MKTKIAILLIFFVVLRFALPAVSRGDEESDNDGGEWYCPDTHPWPATVTRFSYHFPDATVIGSPTEYQVKPKDTLLDIARQFGLGINSFSLLYPHIDPWIPPVNMQVTAPTFFVLPPTRHEQLVINIPELRLYYFDKATSTVQTYPIGLGVQGWHTPTGTYSIVSKRENPTWYVPASLQKKYGMATMPPGPANPLGQFIMMFSAGDYGIHGCACPWGVGRLISHGCVRLYPEHIRLLYPQVPIGTALEIIYKPVKIGTRNGEIYVQAYPDIYNQSNDYNQFAEEALRNFPEANRVDMKRFRLAITLQNGIPTNVTRYPIPDAPQGAADGRPEESIFYTN